MYSSSYSKMLTRHKSRLREVRHTVFCHIKRKERPVRFRSQRRIKIASGNEIKSRTSTLSPHTAAAATTNTTTVIVSVPTVTRI